MKLRTVLLVALIPRVALPLAVWAATGNPKAFEAPDTQTYVRPAETMIQGRFGDPDIVRTPGYPLLLIPGLLVGRLTAVTIALQIALSVASVALVFAVEREAFGGRGWAALLYAVEPLSILYSSKLVSETLFTAMLLLSLWLLKRRSWLGAALALAATAYVRPIVLLLPLLLLWRRPAAMAVAFACTGAWVVRNLAVAGFAGFSAISEVNLYYYYAAAVEARERGVPYYEQQKAFGYGEPSDERPADQARRIRAEATAILRRHPADAVALHARGIVMTMADPGAVELLRMFGAYPEKGGLLGAVADRGIVATILNLKPSVFWSNLILGLAWLALLVLIWRGWPNRATAPLLLTAGFLLALSGGPMATHRFRHPMMPIACLMAAAGLRRRGDWQVELSETIAAPRERVFAMLTDLDRAGEWMPARIERLSPDRWRETRRVFGRDDAREYRLVIHEPPAAVESAGDGGFRFRVEFESVGDATRVTIRGAATKTELIGPLVRWVMRRAIAADLAAAKAWVER